MNNKLSRNHLLVVDLGDHSREWRWRRVAPSGRIISVSAEGYRTREDCVRVACTVNAQPFDLVVPPLDGDDETLQMEPQEASSYGTEEQIDSGNVGA